MLRARSTLIHVSLGCLDLAVIAGCAVVFERAGGGTGWTAQAAASALWMTLLSRFGIYRSQRLSPPLADAGTIAKAGLAEILILSAASAYLPGSLAAPQVIMLAALQGLALVLVRCGLRLALRALRRRGRDVKRLVLFTTPDLGARLAAKLHARDHYGYDILRAFRFDPADPSSGSFGELQAYLRGVQVDEVILGLPSGANALAARIVAECEDHGIGVRIVPDLLPLIQPDARISNLDGIPLIPVRVYPTEYFGYVVLKRAFDVCFSASVLVLLAPLYAAIAAAVKLSSPGPVFFAQERVGLNGRRFTMFKFRTMRQNPDLDPSSHWTIRNDPFVTPVGRWLRRTNLDELPQFLNVLLGDMSVVGPRPERPFFLERFRREVPEYMSRHYVKSGITGWAQINGWRGDTAIDQRVAHDLYYIRNWAMSLDMKILALTLVRTLFVRSAD